MRKKDYDTTVGVDHDETLMAVNQRTGEVREINTSSSRKKRNNGMIKFDLMESFTRINTKAWNLLKTQVSDKELAVAFKMAVQAEAYTNSLRPLHPESTISFIAEYLGQNRNTIMKFVDKLFKLGVIAKFEVYNKNEVHTKYWVFNPYLAFNGNVIRQDVKTLFDGTYYANVH